MRAGNITYGGDAALSALGWWELAGVDVLVEERPRDWLAPSAPAKAPAPVAATPAPAALPETLDVMRALLATDPRFGDAGARVLPAGDAAAGVVVMGDMPDAEDAEEGAPFAGATGRLLDNMLAAIGIAAGARYAATLTPLRPLTGRLRPEEEEAFGELARRHIALAAPRFALLLGEATSRAILGMDLAKARGRLHLINHRGASIRALATYHPRALLGRAAFKAAAWADLRLLLGDFAR